MTYRSDRRRPAVPLWPFYLGCFLFCGGTWLGFISYLIGEPDLLNLSAGVAVGGIGFAVWSFLFKL